MKSYRESLNVQLGTEDEQFASDRLGHIRDRAAVQEIDDLFEELF